MYKRYIVVATNFKAALFRDKLSAKYKFLPPLITFGRLRMKAHKETSLFGIMFLQTVLLVSAHSNRNILQTLKKSVLEDYDKSIKPHGLVSVKVSMTPKRINFHAESEVSTEYTYYRL